jgi:hypothetical protein
VSNSINTAQRSFSSYSLVCGRQSEPVVAKIRVLLAALEDAVKVPAQPGDDGVGGSGGDTGLLLGPEGAGGAGGGAGDGPGDAADTPAAGPAPAPTTGGEGASLCARLLTLLSVPS